MVPCRITGEGEAKGEGLRVVFGDGARAMGIPVSLLPPVEEGAGVRTRASVRAARGWTQHSQAPADHCSESRVHRMGVPNGLDL